MMRTVNSQQIFQSASHGAFFSARCPQRASTLRLSALRSSTLRLSTVFFLLAFFSLSFRALQAAPPTPNRTRSAATKKSAAAKAAVATRNAATRSKVAASSTRSGVFGWLRARPQTALFGGALGVMALAGFLAAVSRPKRARDEAPPPVGDSDETERLQMLLDFERAARKENEVLFWKMAMHGGDALHVTYPREGTIQWFGQVDAMLGYTQNSFPRTVEGWATAIHPDETDKVVALYTEACRGQNEFQIQYRMRHRNGTYREWLHRGRPIFDEKKKLVSFVGACTDVTEKNVALRESRASNEKVAHLLTTSPEGVLVCDAKGYIVSANAAAERLFEATNEALVGAPYAGGHWNVVDPNGVALLGDQMPPARVLQADAPVSKIEHAIQFKDGSTMHVCVNGAPLHDDKGAVCGCVLVLTDLAAQNSAVQQTTLYDAASGLASVPLFQDRLEHAMQRAVNAGTQIAVLMVSEENRAVIDDAATPETRSEWLKIAARRVQGSVREFDTVTLLKNNRFAVLLEDIASHEDAQILVDRVLDATRKPIFLRGEEQTPSPRIGAALSAPRSTPSEIVEQASDALARTGEEDSYFWWQPVSSDAIAAKSNGAAPNATPIATPVSPEDAREKIALVKPQAPSENGSSVYFSTEVVRDEVTSDGLVDGGLAEGLAVRRITQSGVLVEKSLVHTNDGTERTRPHGAANGGVIKSLVALRKAKREMEKARNSEAESVDAFQNSEKMVQAAASDPEEVPPSPPRLLKEA